MRTDIDLQRIATIGAIEQCNTWEEVEMLISNTTEELQQIIQNSYRPHPNTQPEEITDIQHEAISAMQPDSSPTQQQLRDATKDLADAEATRHDDSNVDQADSTKELSDRNGGKSKPCNTNAMLNDYNNNSDRTRKIASEIS